MTTMLMPMPLSARLSDSSSSNSSSDYGMALASICIFPLVALFLQLVKKLFVGRPRGSTRTNDSPSRLNADIRISIKTSSGYFALDVNVYDTVDSVQKKAQAWLELDVVPQLYFSSKKLESRNLLFDYNVQKESTLHLTHGLRGGSEMDAESWWFNSSLCHPCREEPNNEMLLDNDDDGMSIDSFHTTPDDTMDLGFDIDWDEAAAAAAPRVNAYSSGEEDDYAMPLRGGNTTSNGQATATSNNNPPPSARVSTGAATAAAPLHYAPGAFDNPMAMAEEMEASGGGGGDPPSASTTATTTAAKRTDHPFKSLVCLQTGYRRGRGEGNVKLSEEAFHTEVKTWLLEISEQPSLISTDGKVRQGNCLSFLSDKPVVVDAVASALVKHFRLDKEMRQQYLVNEYRHSLRHAQSRWNSRHGAQKTFQLPLHYGKAPEDDEAQTDLKEAAVYPIDLSAWTTLFNLKTDALKSIKGITEGKAGMVHGNAGKSKISKSMEKAYESAHARLTYLKENYATPFATKFCRDVTGQTSTREDSERVTLPPHMNKRSIFCDWCEQNGWQVKMIDKCKAKMAQIKDWELADGFYRTQAEADQHEGGKVALPICSYRSFIRYWDTHFPKLVIRKSGEDTCDDCHRIMLNIRALERKRDAALAKSAAEREANGEADVDGTTPAELSEYADKLQAEIDNVRQHIVMADSNRDKYNEYEKQAAEDIANNVPWGRRTKFFVIDMGQNALLPTLRGEQMGAFYYMSPLVHLIFGVCEAGRKHMNTYIWEESEANRGANNIISCLYKDLEKTGIVHIGDDEEKEGGLGHLVIAADNCSGQNKNKAMIRFCMWLVETGYAKKVTLLFLIKGHTKNECDKSFNLLKMGTKGEDLWTDKQLDAAYTKNNEEYITLERVTHESMFDWTTGLEKVYAEPPSGTTLSNHVFTFGGVGDVVDDEEDAITSTTYRRKLYCGTDKEYSTDLLPSRVRLQMQHSEDAEEARKQAIRNLPDNLRSLPAPGLSAIKANECVKKLGPLAPVEYQPYYLNRMTDKLQDKFDKDKAEKNKKRKDKKQDKKRQIEEANATDTQLTSSNEPSRQDEVRVQHPDGRPEVLALQTADQFRASSNEPNSQDDARVVHPSLASLPNGRFRL